MENIRRTEKNKINNEIRTIQGYIKVDENTILSFKKIETTTEFTHTKVVELRGKNKDREEQIIVLEERLFNLDRGLLDEELNDKKKQEEEENIKSQLERDEQKKAKKDEKKNNRDKSTAFFKKKGKMRREARYEERSADRGIYHYHKAIDTLPSKLKNNLKRMPNNRGYIWRGVHFYGDLNPDRGNTVMIENNRGTLITRETSPTEVKIYEKKGRERQRLVSVIQRKKNVFGTQKSLMDYVNM